MSSTLTARVASHARDIPDIPVLAFLRDHSTAIGCGWHDLLPRDQFCPTVADAMPPVAHERVRLAKMKALLRRGLVHGCTCGCRGDFTITAKGIGLLSATGSAPETPHE